MLTYVLISGCLFGLYYSLVALGLNLVFGVMRIVNLAHGDVLIVAGLLVSGLYVLVHLSPILGLLGIAIGIGLLGIPAYYILIPRLLAGNDPEMMSVILFFGVSQILEALMLFFNGPNNRSIPVEAIAAGPASIIGQVIPGAWIIAGLFSACAVGVLFVYLFHTSAGRRTRAVMSSAEQALARGINVGHVSSVTFGISLALAAIAGGLAPFMFGAVGPADGVGLTIQAFTVIVIGGLGNPLGTILGGLIYGVALMFMQAYLSSWTHLLPYCLLIAMLLIKPNGLFGKAVRRA